MYLILFFAFILIIIVFVIFFNKNTNKTITAELKMLELATDHGRALNILKKVKVALTFNIILVLISLYFVIFIYTQMVDCNDIGCVGVLYPFYFCLLIFIIFLIYSIKEYRFYREFKKKFNGLLSKDGSISYYLFILLRIVAIIIYLLIISAPEKPLKIIDNIIENKKASDFREKCEAAGGEYERFCLSGRGCKNYCR